MEKHWRDVRLSLRSLRHSPTFTVAVIAILALGIGMSAAMFTVFKTVLVDRFPVVAQDRLAILHPLDQRGTHLDVPYTYLDEIARDTALVRGVAGVQHMGAQAIPFLDAGNPIQLGAVAVSSNFFDVVGAQPVVGRFFQPNDSRAGAPPVIVLGYAAWRRRFGGAMSVVGRSLVVPYTQQNAQIIGVAPSGLEYPTGTDAWLVIPTGSTTQVDIVARLTPNVTISAARDRLFSLTQRSNPFPAAARGQGQSVGELKIYGVEARSFVETLLGSSTPVIIALTLGIALLMVIACINIATLIVVRLLGRSRDIAVRLALGAGQRDVARLVVTETTILVIVGGVIGCAASLSVLRLVRALAPLQLPRSDSLDALTAPVGVAAALTLAVILVFAALLGLLPRRIGAYAALRSDSRSGTDSPLREQSVQGSRLLHHASDRRR